MSTIGTGVAAGVAQTAYQAQQVARERDRRKNEAARGTAAMREMLEARMNALEEGQEDQTPVQLHIDGQLPEHHTAPVERPQEHRAGDDAPAEPVDGQAPVPRDDDATLYRHLDVTA